MKFQAAILALLVASAAGHSMRGVVTMKMQPEVVAHTLLKVEEEWRSQAAAWAECNATATDASTECTAAKAAFGQSCATVVNAVVKASSGDRSNVREYLSDVCAEAELKGWRQERCSTMATAVNKVMTDNSYDNRESFDSNKACTSFWSVFVVDEQARLVKEKAEREAEEKREAEERAAAEKKAAEEKAAAEKEAAEAEKRRLAEEADRKAAEAQERAEEAAQRLADKQAEAAKVAEEAAKKAEEAKAVAEEVKEQQAHLNKTMSELNSSRNALSTSAVTNATVVATNATTGEQNATKAETVTVEAAKNTSTAQAAPQVENTTATATVAPQTENKTAAVRASNTSLIQAVSCATRRLGVSALLAEKAAALGPVCEEMCKEIGVYPNCQCPGFAGQPASADDARACIVKYCQDASNKCPNDGFSTCVAENTKVSALQWDAVMSHVSHGFESLAAAVRMSKSKK